MAILRGHELFGRIGAAKPVNKQLLIGAYTVRFTRPTLSLAQLQALGMGKIYCKDQSRSYYFSPEETTQLGQRLRCEKSKNESTSAYFDRLTKALFQYSRSAGAQVASSVPYASVVAEEIVFDGAVLETQAYVVNQTLLSALGIRPELLRDYAYVHLASQAQFSEYQEVNDFTAGLCGIYNPNAAPASTETPNGEFVMHAKQRVALVPEDTGAETVLHELFHDLFANMDVESIGNMQMEFYHLVLQEVRAAFRSPGDRSLAFFQDIAKRTLPPISLGDFVNGRELNFTAFVNEVFAYCGTLAAGYPDYVSEAPVVGVPPKSIIQWLKENIVLPEFDAGKQMIDLD